MGSCERRGAGEGSSADRDGRLARCWMPLVRGDEADADHRAAARTGERCERRYGGAQRSDELELVGAGHLPVARRAAELVTLELGERAPNVGEARSLLAHRSKCAPRASRTSSTPPAGRSYSHEVGVARSLSVGETRAREDPRRSSARGGNYNPNARTSRSGVSPLDWLRRRGVTQARQTSANSRTSCTSRGRAYVRPRSDLRSWSHPRGYR